jgi:hypothetical protein
MYVDSQIQTMGAAASIEAANPSKPLDGSDIQPYSLEVSKAEIIRLRMLLGHLAAQAGFDTVVLDASDLILGEDDEEDHIRCCDAVRHIRSCLQLSTQQAKRSARSYARPDPTVVFAFGNSPDDAEVSDESSDESIEEKDTGSS